MVTRDAVTKVVEEIIGRDILDKAVLADPGPNSVQIKGKPQVSTIALGVSCSPEFIRKAVEINADYLICHHGLFTNYDIVRGRFDALESRLKTIIKNDITLAGYHYALDAHPEIGNNAQIIKKLVARPTGESYFDGWGYIAQFALPITVDDLSSRLESIMKHPIYTVKAGPNKIKRIGVCSGGAKPGGSILLEAIDKHIDAHISGEIIESSPSLAIEAGFNYFACGHYATETFGVKALAKKLTDHFSLEVKVTFIDVPSTL
jgi:dinuclear metal center YbgI/SA1388 family protein